MKWLLENVQGLKDKENLVFGTIDAYLIARLNQCTKIVTDSSNAGRTMLMDINTLEWSDKMLSEYGIKKEWLPEIQKKSSDDFTKVTCPELNVINGVQISGVLGD